MNKPVHSPQFRKGLLSIVKGDKLIAPLRSYLMDPSFPGFTVEVKGLGRREPDYWFHPSEHPGLSERALYLWMTSPDLLVRELQEPTAILSMTAGSIWHSIIQHSLTTLGLLSHEEYALMDELRRTRGKADGIMTGGEELFELKTMKDAILRQIGSTQDYLDRYPTYHAQANEYMRMSGIHRERVLLMSLTFPYDMREFVVEYDHLMGKRQEQKYERVLQAVADQRMPMCDGCYKSNNCPARSVCLAELQEGS
jgi:hypothetical protein